MSRSNREESTEFLTLPEAARQTGLGLRQLVRARDRGQLAVYLVGGWHRTTLADVVAWVERQRVHPEVP
jgi:hypothetical protein